MRALTSNFLERSPLWHGQTMAPFTGSTFVPVPKQSLQTSDVLESVARLFDSGLSIIDSLVRDYNIRVLKRLPNEVTLDVIS